MKLITDKIVKLPKASRDVKSILRKACLAAEREGWKRVIIIGEGKDSVRSLYSAMDMTTAVGLLEIEKGINIRDIENSDPHPYP